ncbi:MAG: NAD(P)-dependent oxidoreductase [Acidobacteriota bacterium]|nr:NAD(P)-dependent oxidoreductase [Acidobacteriota bacterium]
MTGAKGCIGSWIVKSLIERGDDPWIFDVDEKSHRLEALLDEEQLKHVRFIRGDVRQIGQLDEAVSSQGITHIIHLAALQVPACAANPVLGAEVNVIGTLNVFEIAKRRQNQVKRIVYASSAAVFGPDEFYEGKKVMEGAVLHPGTHYGVFKVSNEGNARVYFASNGISSAGLRPWAVYGAGRDQGMTSAPTKAIKAVVAGRPFTIRFTGGLDLQYVRDTARDFLRAADSDLAGAFTYSLRGAVVRVAEFIETLDRVAPGAKRLVRAEGKQLPIAADINAAEIARDLGDVAPTPLETGIRETYELFLRKQREGQLDISELDA